MGNYRIPPSPHRASVYFRRSLTVIPGTCLLSLTLAVSSIYGSGPGSEPPPNIVFILADDLGWHQLGSYGSRYYPTPNLDRLASEGMRFTNAYAAAPICSPTRASIMTGKYPARLHLTNYIAGDKTDRKLLPPDWTKYLPLDELTIAEALQAVGFVTGHFGKWHLNRDKNYRPGRPGDPGSQGFDVVLTTHKPSADSDMSDPHNVRRITDHAIRFIRENRGRPFFCYIAHNSVHRPEWERLELVAKYENHPLRWAPGNRPVMAAMVEVLDRGIGRLLDAIEQLGLADNTIVIFFSDNGMFDNPLTRKPLRAGKGFVYEGGIRVPLLVRWPRKVAAGSICDVPVISNDFFPTLIEAAGGRPAAYGTDGVSLLPLLLGIGTLDRSALFFHYPHYSPQGGSPAGAVRQGRFKLVIDYERLYFEGDNAGALELYDLRSDPGEARNLAPEMPGKARELFLLHQEWLKDVGGQEPIKNPRYGETSSSSAAIRDDG